MTLWGAITAGQIQYVALDIKLEMLDTTQHAARISIFSYCPVALGHPVVEKPVPQIP